MVCYSLFLYVPIYLSTYFIELVTFYMGITHAKSISYSQTAMEESPLVGNFTLFLFALFDLS